jgi:class 3 adenylate cyclase
MEPGAPARVERRLAAILVADIAGYSRLIEADEEGTLARLKVLRNEVIDPKIAGDKGRIVKTTGDGLLVEFSSVVALRLSPRESMGSPLSLMGLAHFFKRPFDEAAAKLVLAVQDHPGFPVTYRHLAACYAHMGRLDEARATVAKLRAITPVVVPSNLPAFRNPEDREFYLSGLRRAAGKTV